MILKYVAIFLLQIIFVSGQEEINSVRTKFGRIKGKQQKLRDGTPLYVFLGIPYAIQPLADLRFKDPLPLTESYPDEFIEATQAKRCVQYLPTIQKVIGEEDCLRLNIYTTKLDSKAGHDVLVFIHGGAFAYGAGHSQTPDYLYDHKKNLVFVSINYRLGPFGFLSTDDDIVPGNMGLKDQVVALQWIYSNIESFGGNRGNIVLAGMSAGGISVHLHYLSPLSRDLFTKGISMSGVALSRLVKTKNIREGFENLANLFPDCLNDDSTLNTINCLSKIPAIKMMETLIAQKKPWEDYNSYEYFGPVIEKRSAKPFLDEHPFHLLRKGKVKQAPWLVSATTAEGLHPAGLFVDDVEKMKVLNENWNDIAPYLLVFKEFAKEKDLPKISELVRKHYLGDEQISFANRKEIIRLVGDRLFMTSIENALRLHAAASRTSVYMYMFDYRGKKSFSTLLSRTDSNLGVSHTDDLIYVMKISSFDPHSQDLHIHDVMLKIWCSFINDGVPNTGTGVRWPAISTRITYVGNIDYMLIGNEAPKVISKSFLSERVFWDILPLDELHISGDLFVPKYIQDLQSQSWLPSKDELKANVIIARLERIKPLAYFLKKRILQNARTNRGK